MNTVQGNPFFRFIEYDDEKTETCERCGKTFTIRHSTYFKKWIGECECIKAEKQRIEAEQKEKQEIDRLIANSGIPKRYISSTFDNFTVRAETKNAYEAARLYFEKFTEFNDTGSGLIFTGNTGSGKTRLATAIGIELIKERKKAVKFVPFNSLIDQINYGDSYGKAEAEVIRKYKNCPLLILDDICVTNVSDKWKRVLYSIIDGRINDIKPTIYTTNITSLDEIKTRLNEQIYDRITGSCAEIRVAASSFRQIKNF